MDSTFSSTSENIDFTENDFSIEWFSGTGKGGQHRNKKQNSCRVVHVPTGLTESRQGRHREMNLREAFNALESRLRALQCSQEHKKTSIIRQTQVGSGMRGDKTVTIRFQDDRVQHHMTGKSMKAGRYMRGFMDEVWN